MGWLDSRREKKTAEQAAHAAEQKRAALARWQQDRDELAGMLEWARDFEGFTPAQVAEAGATVMLKAGEGTHLIAEGAALVEARRAPGTYQAGYAGFSFKVMKGVRYNVGGARGTYTPGPEQPTVIDQGTAVVTDQRVIFQGPKYSREWRFDKMLGYAHDPELPWVAIQVTNRQKVSGILYGSEGADLFQFRLAAALADYAKDRSGLVSQLTRQLMEHDAAKPSL